MHFAAFFGNTPCAESLLKAGADTGLKDLVKDSAHTRGAHDTREYMIRGLGRGGLHIAPRPFPRGAAASCTQTATSSFPPYPASPPRQHGDTALDFAMRRKHVEVVRLLENAPASAVQVSRAAPQRAAPGPAPALAPAPVSTLGYEGG